MATVLFILPAGKYPSHRSSVFPTSSSARFTPYGKSAAAEIFNRDQFTCQYCGKQTRQLTLDHVIPRYRGGQHTWENVVSACAACNRRKAGRTPEEANMKLHKIPAPPRANRYSYIPTHYMKLRHEWERYFPH